MARSTTLEKTTVFAVIEGLLAAGEYPTAARVREQLDGRGSPVVLQRFLGDWYGEFGPELARKAAAAPKGVAGGLQAELKRLTANAVQEVEAAQADRIAALDTRGAELDGREKNLKDREDKQDLRESAHAELLVDLRQQLATAAAHHTQLEEARQQALEEASACRRHAEAHTATLSTMDRELQQLRVLAEQVPVLKASLDRANADAAREQARVVELVNERDQLQRQCSDRRAELAKVQALLDSAVAAAGEQEARFIGQREQLQEALAQVAVAKSRGEALAVELDQAAGRRLADSERIESLRAEISAGERDRAGLTVRLDVALQDVERLGVLGAGITSLKEEIGRLGMKIGQSQKESEKPLSTD